MAKKSSGGQHDPFAEAAGVDAGSVDFGDMGDVSDGEETGEGLVVDLTNTTDKKFEAVPRGIYDCTVESLDYSLSQRSGNPMWTWVFEVEDGEYARRKFFYHTVFNEAGMPRVKRTLARIKTDDGAEQKLLSGPFSPVKVADDGILLGARCRVRVGIRRYEGQNRNDVKDVLAPNDGEGGFAV